MEIVHTPVLPEEIVFHLAGAAKMLDGSGLDELFVDCTLGEGGHTELFLSRFPLLRVIGIDADKKIMLTAKERLERFRGRIVFHCGWADDFFKYYPKNSGSPRPGIILMDLGVSLFHYEKGERGFSFNSDEPLDMRIDTSKGRSAAELLAVLSEEKIAKILFENADERYSRRIARFLVKERANGYIKTSAELAAAVRAALPVQAAFRRNGLRRIDPSTKTFQALRIAVNGELERLSALLDSAFSALKPGGRIGVVSFHSAEDRIVKNFFRAAAKDCVCPPSAPACVCRGRRLARLITQKPVSPSKEEIERNPASRSAKLRVVEKVWEEGESSHNLSLVQ